MANTWYLYVTESEIDLAAIVERHQDEFDALLGDTFSDEELDRYGGFLDELASVSSHALIEDMQFEDLSCDPALEEAQRAFFANCRSLLCFENAPYLENNPFQVTYLRELLKCFSEVLVDAGDELLFKNAWLHDLQRLRGIETLVKEVPHSVRTSVAVHVPTHVDRMVEEIYREIGRLRALAKLPDPRDMAERRQRLYESMLQDEANADELLGRCGLNPKDFGDGLEGLKFFLKKIT